MNYYGIGIVQEPLPGMCYCSDFATVVEERGAGRWTGWIMIE